jgi:hypothetical protein
VDELKNYVIDKLAAEKSPEARAVAALMSIPTRVQKLMSEAELEATIKSVADAIRRAEENQTLREPQT